MWRCEVDSTGSRYGAVVGYYEHGNETPSSINIGNFLSHPNDYRHLKKDSMPRSWWLYYCYRQQSSKRWLKSSWNSNPLFAFIIQRLSWLPLSVSAFSSHHCVSSLGSIFIQSVRASVHIPSVTCKPLIPRGHKSQTSENSAFWKLLASQADKNRWVSEMIAHKTNSL
jgi:hypothetical protein